MLRLWSSVWCSLPGASPRARERFQPRVSPDGAAVAFAREVNDHVAYGRQGTRLHVVNNSDHRTPTARRDAIYDERLGVDGG